MTDAAPPDAIAQGWRRALLLAWVLLVGGALVVAATGDPDLARALDLGAELAPAIPASPT